MVDERAAYPESSRRSEQLSYITLFHLSYGLFSINFQSFKQFLEFREIIINSNLNGIARGTQKCTQQAAHEADMGAELSAQSAIDLSKGRGEPTYECFN